MLIKKEDEETYSFESPDSFQIISASISEAERRQWHLILAKYFTRRLNHLKSSHFPYRAEQEIVFLHSAARHYQFSGEYGMAVGYYYELAHGYMGISDPAVLQYQQRSGYFRDEICKESALHGLQVHNLQGDHILQEIYVGITINLIL